MAMRATMPRPPLLSVNNLPRVIAIAIAPSRHRAIAAAIGFGDLFAVARRFKAFAEHQAFGHSQTAAAASFQRALFTPGADEFLGPPHALAAQMRLHASRRAPPKPHAPTRVCRTSSTYLVPLQKHPEKPAEV